MKTIWIVLCVVAICGCRNELPESAAKTYSHSCCDDGFVFCDGVFADDSFSASVVVDKRLEWSTTGEWTGAVYPEHWSYTCQEYLPDYRYACISREDSPKNLTVSLLEKGTWRLHATGMKGSCRYNIVAQ